MTVRFVTDSSCDIPARVLARYGIYFVPLNFNVDSQRYHDGIDITRDEYFKRFQNYSNQPTTTILSPKNIHAIYDVLLLKMQVLFYLFTSPVPREQL